MSLIPDAEQIKTIPNTLLVVTLMSNFGTFMLYMLTCAVAIVAFREHHTFNTVKHTFIPLFGLVANLACMLFYLVGPFTVSGMSWKEPYIALLAAALWGLYGAFYFVRASSKKGKTAFLTEEHKAAALAGSNG
jgi:CDP-diglyceride synthetase